MRRSDGDGERVAACAGREINHFLRLRVMRLLGRNLFLNASQHAQLSLNSHVVLVSIINDFSSESDVVLVREGGAIDHD